MSVWSKFYGQPALGQGAALDFSPTAALFSAENPSSIGSAQEKVAFPTEYLEKYPELKNITDPNIINAYKTLPSLNYDDIPYGPGFQPDRKGRPSEYHWAGAMRNTLGKLGFFDWENKRVKLPTTMEEIDKWKWMDTYLRNLRQNKPIKQHPASGAEALGPNDWGYEYYKMLSPGMKYNERLGYWTGDESEIFSYA